MRKKRNNKKISIKQLIITLLIFTIIVLIEYFAEDINKKQDNTQENINTSTKVTYSSLLDVPEYTNEICVEINDNKPYFTEADYTTEAFEKYSELDYLGRCGVAYANKI